MELRMKRIGFFAIAVFLFFLCYSSAAAGTIRLRWDPVNGSSVAGYKIYYGTWSGNYADSIDVGNVTDYTINTFEDCITYYLTVKSYDSSGIESLQYSNEVSGMPNPAIQSVTPSSAKQGDVLSVTISGENFDDASRPEFDNQGITVISYDRISCTEISVDISVNGGDGEKPAELSTGAVSVINSNGIVASASSAFTVTLNVGLLDTDNNGKIDGIDLSNLARHFGYQEGSGYYDPSVDFNGDGWVDGNDLAILAAHFGENLP